MAARVNVKFVVLLSVALVAIMAAVVYAAMTVVLKTGQDYADRAAEFEQAGEYKDAARNWENAVGHDRTRLEWLEGWRSALEKVEYDSEPEYLSDRQMHLQIHRVIADVKGTDVQAHREYLDQLTYGMRAQGVVAVPDYEFVANQVEAALLAYPDSDTAARGQIRRYRGIIGVAAMRSGSVLGEDRVTLIREDLLAALEADPADEAALVALVQVDGIRANNAELERRTDIAQQIWSDLGDAVNSFVETNPASIRGRVQQATIELLSDLLEVEARGLFGADVVEARIEVVAEHEPTVRAIVDDYLEAGPDRTGHSAASELTGLIGRSIREGATDLIVSVWDHTLAEHPDDQLVIHNRANYLRNINRYQEAIDSFQALRDLPQPPVSAEGAVLIGLKRAAGVAMGTCAFEQWNTRTTNAGQLERGSPERQALLDQAQSALQDAREHRDQAAAELPEDEPNLVLLNARIAFAEGDIPLADRLARRYNETTGDRDPQGLRLAARIADSLGNIGEQARLLGTVLSLAPNDVRTMLEYAQVQIELREYASAEQLLTRAKELRPDLDMIDDSLARVSAVLGNTEIDDPFEAAIVEAQRAINAGDVDEAIRVLQAALDNNPTPDHIRVHTVLAASLIQAGEVERAVAVADAGLEIDPSSRSLQLVKRQAEIGDDIDALDAFIDSQTQLTDAQRALQKYRARIANGQLEDAGPFIEQALQAAPDDRNVLLSAFEYALTTGDLDQARSIIASTEGKDIDGANGLTLRARLDIAEGRYEEAERTLTAAVERGSLNATTLSLLGRVQSLQGDNLDAIESFRRARDIRPNEIGYTNDYIRALASSGQQNAALDAARETLDLGRNNTEFRSLWLALEGAVGSKQVAYDERVAISESNPDNAENTAALIRLCLDLRKFDEARTRLDAARAQNDSLVLCRLDANWHMQRGDVAGAAEQFQSFLISDTPGADSPAAYIAFASFLIENGQLDAGLTTLRQGRRVQSDENPVVDFELARRLFLAGRYGPAAETLEDIAESAPADSEVASRSRTLLIETYTRLGEWETAEARVNELTDEQREQLDVRLLEVEIARGTGDSAAARVMLDDTISAFPNEPMPYLRRGTLLMTDSALVGDAIEDFTRAIELDPANAEAYRFRAISHMSMGNDDLAAADIVDTTRAQPFDDQIRVVAANRLIEMGREGIAADVIDEGLERSAGNLRLLVNAGSIFARADNHLKAVQYLQSAWEQSKDASVASMLLDSMLALPRPDLRAARQITSDPALDQQSPQVLLMRAGIEAAAENWSAAESLLTEIYTANRDNPQIILTWANTLERVLDGRDRALAYLQRLEAREGLSPWARFAHARLLALEESGRSQARETLTALINSTTNDALRLSSLRMRSVAHYQEDNFQAALDDMLAALELVPEDPELNNNIAYVMGVDLGRAREALPYAQLAVERAPENRGILDTLGTVYIEAGEPEKAIAPLERALTLSTTDAERAPVLVHLARARLETGNRPGAEDAANAARDIMNELDEPSETVQAELQSVLDDINSR